MVLLPVLVFLFQDPLIKSLEGKDLYAAYCASCHGMDGKGSGPASAAMKTAPPDLTTVTKRRGKSGKYPEAYVEALLTGNGKTTADKMVPSHGSSEMPVWGPVFRQVERDQDLGLIRLRNVVKYVESIQAKPASGKSPKS